MPGDFIDTNVIVYLLSRDSAKADRAESILEGGGTISVQVLNELTNVARRKAQLSWAETRDLLSFLRRLLQVVPIGTDTHDAGLDLAERYQLSTYDAMIAASALLAECNTLWSEDMQDGMMLEGKLQIKNPFRQKETPSARQPRRSRP